MKHSQSVCNEQNKINFSINYLRLKNVKVFVSYYSVLFTETLRLRTVIRELFNGVTA